MSRTEKLYLQDSYLKEFSAQVVELFASRKRPPKEAASGKGKKKKDEQYGAVVFDRTVFFATGGGQLNDKGHIYPEEDPGDGGEGLKIVDVVEEERTGKIYHFFRQAPGGVPPPWLGIGSRIRGVLDWNRRRDHMQQHHGQVRRRGGNDG